jgi:hypothetical protein
VISIIPKTMIRLIGIKKDVASLGNFNVRVNKPKASDTDNQMPYLKPMKTIHAPTQTDNVVIAIDVKETIAPGT